MTSDWIVGGLLVVMAIKEIVGERTVGAVIKEALKTAWEFANKSKNEVLETVTLMTPVKYGREVEGKAPEPDPQIEEVFRLLKLIQESNETLMVRIEQVDAKIVSHIEKEEEAVL